MAQLQNPVTPEEESAYFTVVDDNGNEVQCEVLFTYEDTKTGKNYIVYTDYSTDDSGQYKVFASVYVPDSEDTTLYPIETEEEWAQVEAVLAELESRVEDIDNWDVTAVD